MPTPAQLPHSRPPLARMMRIHQEFQDARLTNCTQLAELLEVSTKTIARDLEFMRDQLGLPVEYDAQIYAWRYAHPVKNFPTVQVSEGELLALLVAQKALVHYRGTPFHDQLAQAFDKLSRGLQDRVSFSPAGSHTPGSRPSRQRRSGTQLSPRVTPVTSPARRRCSKAASRSGEPAPGTSRSSLTTEPPHQRPAPPRRHRKSPAHARLSWPDFFAELRDTANGRRQGPQNARGRSGRKPRRGPVEFARSSFSGSSRARSGRERGLHRGAETFL